MHAAIDDFVTYLVGERNYSQHTARAYRADLIQFAEFVEEGYEGAMLRIDSPYKHCPGSQRSRKLLKMKPTYDEEYRVVGWTTGSKGKAADLLMLICEVIGTDGAAREFAVTPAVTEEVRRDLATKMDTIVGTDGDGKPITYFDDEWKDELVRVYYDEFSVDGVPLRGRTRLERLGREIAK